MDATTAALLGALIGALAGVGAAVLPTIGQLRASQLAQRAPLADHLQGLAMSIIDWRTEIDDGGTNVGARARDVQIAWSKVAHHQMILCPSERIVSILILGRDVIGKDWDSRTLLPVVGMLNAVVGEMVAAHSRHLFRWRAEMAECRVLDKYLRERGLPVEVRSTLEKITYPQFR